MSGLEVIATLGGALLLGVAIPWLGMRMLVPSLSESPSATSPNYCGRPVFYGLGIAWLIWAGSAIVGGVVASGTGTMQTLAVLTLAGPLALVAFALGVVDDAYGTSSTRGFKGHLKAMLGGRLTTGGLKLVGIGTACLVVSLVVGQVAPWGADGSGPTFARRLVGVLVAGAAIALTSNLVNLMDLRPGRALKSYSVLAVLGAVVCPIGLRHLAGASGQPAIVVVEMLALAVFAVGPVVATWRYDLGERGMLGDAGANPMGAVAGLLIVAGLPLWALLGYFAVVLGLNLASERVSFSQVIESNRALRWLDTLGRLPATAETLGKSKSGPQQETNHE